MKRSASLLLSLLMMISVITCVPITAGAASKSDLTFVLSDDGESYRIMVCDTSASGELVIPDEYKGKPVKYIEGYAFRDCKKLTSITVGKNIKEIGWYAFNNCTRLSTITIPAGVQFIDVSAFFGCPALKSISVSKKNKNYTSSDGVLFNKDKTEIVKFPIKKSSTSYAIPGAVKAIGRGAFYHCTGLKSITIPASVRKIGGSAFEECENLTKVKIPNKVTELSYDAFANCTSLTKIAIPDSVKSIGPACFYDCKNLVSVSFGTGFEEIPHGAFSQCKSIKSIIIPYNIKTVSYGAFYGCTSLKSVKIPYTVKNIYDEAFGYYYSDTKERSVKIKGFKVYGKKGSAAQTYAKDNGFEFVAVTDPGKTKIKTIKNTSSGVKLTWSEVEKAEYYEVYRKVKDGKLKYIGRTTKESYTDKTAKSGKKYYYKVRSVNAAAKSDFTSAKSILFLDNPTLKTPSSTKSGIALKWSKITGAQGYVIYRKVGSGNYKKLKTEKGASNLSYTDKTAKKGKTYTYKVKAYNSKTYSVFSNTKKIKDKY